MSSFAFLINILSFILLAVAVSNAALPSELYWQNSLPNTPMPKALHDLLLPGKINKPAHIGVQRRDVRIYTHGVSEDQLHNKDYSFFFLQKDLHPATNFNLHLTRTTAETTFLPRHVADSLPFSSNKLPDILKYFSLNPQSKEAEVVKQTIKDCETPAIEGEERFCATSLESMVDYSTAKLGTNKVRVMATEVEKKVPKQKYRIEGVVKSVVGDKSMVCHNLNYGYAVFYCHLITRTKAYLVPLVGEDGTKVKAVAVCHSDTSKWNPKHLAFQVLKVKPGTVPVCHFLPEDHIVWVSN